MWARIHHDARTPLVRINGVLNAQIYRDEILQHHTVPLINVNGGILQHDIARLHTARVCHDQQDQQIYPENKISGKSWNCSWLYGIMSRHPQMHHPKSCCLQASSLCSCDCSTRRTYWYWLVWLPMIGSHHVTHFGVDTSRMGSPRLDNTVTFIWNKWFQSHL